MTRLFAKFDWLLRRTRQLSNMSYWSAEAYCLLAILLRRVLSRRSETLLIYQMGKVGSLTVQRSLRARQLGSLIYHVHTLQPGRLRREKKFLRENYGRIGEINDAFLNGRFFRGRLGKANRGQRLKIITMVREPISRNISDFFQNLEFLYNYEYRSRMDASSLNELVADLIRMFWDNFDGHEEHLNWFNLELHRHFGVDVYAHEFPKEKGYQIIHHAAADVLIMRLENLNECAAWAVKNFLDIDNFCLLSENVGSRKAYAPVYRQFLEAIRIPESYLDRMYGGRYMNHFYTAGEVARFTGKWLRRKQEA